MPRYMMAGLEPDPEPLDVIAEQYEASGEFIADALGWICDHGHEFADLVDLATNYYRGSSMYATMLDDIADGVVEL